MTPLDKARTSAAEVERLRTRLAIVLATRDAAVQNAYAQGLNMQTIATATGMSRSQVRNVCLGKQRKGEQ